MRSVVHQGLSLTCCHGPHAVPLQTRRDVISRCGFPEMDKGAVTPPTGPTPWSLCRSAEIIRPPSSSTTTCSLPSASEARGNRSAMQQVDKRICVYTYVCACTHVYVLVAASFCLCHGALRVAPPPRLGTTGRRMKSARRRHPRGICP